MYTPSFSDESHYAVGRAIATLYEAVYIQPTPKRINSIATIHPTSGRAESRRIVTDLQYSSASPFPNIVASSSSPARSRPSSSTGRERRSVRGSRGNPYEAGPRHYPLPTAELIYEWIMNGRVSLMAPSYDARRAKRGRNRKSAYSLRLREVR